MTKETIIREIENFKYLGIQAKTIEEEIGWYLIFKLKVSNNFFEKYSHVVDEYFVDEQKRRKNLPYSVIERKVSKDFFLKNTETISDDDYIKNKTLNFETIEEVFDFFFINNYSLNDFVWLTDLKSLE